MIFSTSLSRAQMGDLQIDPLLERFIHAWRAYDLPAEPGQVLVFMQTSMPVELIRLRFNLPRLAVNSMDRMLYLLVDRPGLLGECVFSGGHFTRMLRRPAQDLRRQFELAVEEPAAPVNVVDRFLEQVQEVVDLTLEPDTPAPVDTVGPLLSSSISSSISLSCMETPFAPCK